MKRKSEWGRFGSKEWRQQLEASKAARIAELRERQSKALAWLIEKTQKGQISLTFESSENNARYIALLEEIQTGTPIDQVLTKYTDIFTNDSRSPIQWVITIKKRVQQHKEFSQIENCWDEFFRPIIVASPAQQRSAFKEERDTAREIHWETATKHSQEIFTWLVEKAKKGEISLAQNTSESNGRYIDCLQEIASEQGIQMTLRNYTDIFPGQPFSNFDMSVDNFSNWLRKIVNERASQHKDFGYIEYRLSAFWEYIARHSARLC